MSGTNAGDHAGTQPPAEPAPGPAPPRRYRTAEADLAPRAQLPIAAALALLLSVCTGAAYLGIASQRQAAQAAHEDSVDTTTAALRDELLAAEASQRGFLITGRAAYLQPYQAALAPIAGALDRLDAMLAGETARTAMARQLRADVTRKLDEMRRTISLAQSGQSAAARGLVNSDLGQQLSEAIDVSLGDLQKSIGAARHAATLRQSRSIALLMVAIAAAAAGAILMAALAARELRRQLRLRHKRESQLDRLVASLEARVARRTRLLEETNQRFEIALDCARVTVFSQGSDLRYTWVSRDFRDLPPDRMIGRTDADFLPPDAAATLTGLKLAVIATGKTSRSEICIDYPPSPIWYEVNLVPTLAPDGTVNGLIGGAADISERKHYESHIRTLMREVTHRSKNLLAVVQALMRQTASRAASVQDFSERFSARLESLAGAYDLLIKDDWRGTTMDQLVRSQLARFAVAQETQIDISGPHVHVPPDATQNIGMALHELATNAAKFGALSVQSGRVSIHWQIERDEKDEPCCRIFWQESGGPRVTPPDNAGFGQIVIERTVARAVGGRVTLAYQESGLEWMLVFPLRE